MKIAMMVRAYIPVPRPLDLIYAPIDIATAIAQGLAKRGHEIDFFAPLGSEIPGVHVESLHLRQLAASEPEFRAIVNDPSLKGHAMPMLWDDYLSSEMFTRAGRGQYDLLHFHHTETALPYARLDPRTPVVYTMHDPIYPWYKEVFELYHSPNQSFVSISNNQRRDAPDLPYTATIYNGVDIDRFLFSAEAEDYLLIAGRVVPEKGFKEAIQIAQQTGNRLLIAGPVYPDHQGYFDQYIKPHLNDKVLYLGNLEQSQLACYYQKAKAFLTPVQWEEPFGLTTVEAMACGTPVISLRRGAAPEIILHRKTGFVVDSIADMCAAVEKIDKIDRAACRKHVQEHFGIDRMVDAYEATFEKLCAQHKKSSRGSVATRLRRVPGTIKKTTQKAKDLSEKINRKKPKAS